MSSLLLFDFDALPKGGAALDLSSGILWLVVVPGMVHGEYACVYDTPSGSKQADGWEVSEKY